MGWQLIDAFWMDSLFLLLLDLGMLQEFIVHLTSASICVLSFTVESFLTASASYVAVQRIQSMRVQPSLVSRLHREIAIALPLSSKHSQDMHWCWRS